MYLIRGLYFIYCIHFSDHTWHYSIDFYRIHLNLSYHWQAGWVSVKSEIWKYPLECPWLKRPKDEKSLQKITPQAGFEPQTSRVAGRNGNRYTMPFTNQFLTFYSHLQSQVLFSNIFLERISCSKKSWKTLHLKKPTALNQQVP